MVSGISNPLKLNLSMCLALVGLKIVERYEKLASNFRFRIFRED